MSRVVKDYYDELAERERGRLVRDAYHRLEHIVTTHFLEKYLPPKGLILDAGGGPGRYTIQLAKEGYERTNPTRPITKMPTNRKKTNQKSRR